MTQLKLFLLGPPLVGADGQPVDFQRRKMLALLVYLAISGHQQHRNTLATLFWPDQPQKEARANLRRELSLLNTTLGGAFLDYQKEIVSLRSQAEIWLDVDQFLDRLAWVDVNTGKPGVAVSTLIDTLVEAVRLYRSDFLTGFTLRNCLDFDDWQFFQTESLRGAFEKALELLVRLYEGARNYFLALQYARRWVSVDRLHEPAHYSLMSLFTRTGQKAAALRQYEVFSRLLSRELNITPSAETTALYHDIRTGKIKADLVPEP